MAEPKPIASLSSGLLARKGAARPAMRRQGLGGMMPQAQPHDDLGQEDLGWDDMGYDVDPPHDAPLHDPGMARYGNLLAGAIPDALPEGDDPVVHQHEPEPVVPDVVRQQEEIADRMAHIKAAIAPPPEPMPEQAPEPAPEPEPAPAASVLSVKKQKAAAPAQPVPGKSIATSAHGRRAAFTLRLDSERHLKLRLASAVAGQSAQQLVTAALDEMLTKIPEIADLAGRVPRSAAR